MFEKVYEGTRESKDGRCTDSKMADIVSRVNRLAGDSE